MYGATTVGDLNEDNNEFYSGFNSTNARAPRFPGLYVGNLTWWTTDQDVINAINSVGINDVQEVKFFENRNNGQSKGFCVVTFSSETSLPTVIEKLPKLNLYGQNPVVTPYNRQNLNVFELQTKVRPQINSNNGPNQHATGMMGISSISGVHAGTQGLPYSGLNSVNQGVVPGAGGAGPRTPSFHTNMRMQMRAPRPLMRGSIPGSMSNGPMIPGGHTMNRMRFMGQPQAWNNSQGGGAYNSATRMPTMNIELSSRLGLSGKPDDAGVGQDLLSAGLGVGGGGGGGGGGSGLGSQTYYTPHHPNSQSDHYRGDVRDHRDLRDDRERDRDRDRDSSRRLDDRLMRQDERSLRHEDSRSLRQDDRSSKHEERSSRHRDERSSRREEGRSSITRRGGDDRGSSSRKEERSSRREEKSSRREKSHRSERARSRSRDKSRERSKEVKKERKDRRERY